MAAKRGVPAAHPQHVRTAGPLSFELPVSTRCRLLHAKAGQQRSGCTGLTSDIPASNRYRLIARDRRRVLQPQVKLHSVQLIIDVRQAALHLIAMADLGLAPPHQARHLDHSSNRVLFLQSPSSCSQEAIQLSRSLRFHCRRAL